MDVNTKSFKFLFIPFPTFLAILARPLRGAFAKSIFKSSTCYFGATVAIIYGGGRSVKGKSERFSCTAERDSWADWVDLFTIAWGGRWFNLFRIGIAQHNTYSSTFWLRTIWSERTMRVLNGWMNSTIYIIHIANIHRHRTSWPDEPSNGNHLVWFNALEWQKFSGMAIDLTGCCGYITRYTCRYKHTIRIRTHWVC
jgi:hypothetical protein